MAQLWDWIPRPTRTRLLHDVAAKPAVLSTQSMTRYSFILLSREKQVWVSFLLKETATVSPPPGSNLQPSSRNTRSRMSSPSLYHLLHRPPKHTMDKCGQMLSPPRHSTSIESVMEIAPLPLETRPSCATWRLKGQCYNPPGVWPQSSRDTDYGAALGLDAKTHTYPSADVTAKPAFLSTPVKDQVLIYTIESRKEIMP